MMLEQLPDDLKRCPQWLVWRKTWLADKNRFTKVPYSVRTQYPSSVRKPDEWCSFEQAVAAYTANADKLSGLGFVFGYASGLSGLDLDDALTSTGSVASYQAVEIARRFDTYTEISPSGTGLHSLFYGNVPDGRRSRGIELYGEGRYFTMTGNPYFALPVGQRQETADSLREFIDAQRAQAVSVAVDWGVEPTFTDHKIYEIAVNAENGTKFFDLWNDRWQQYYGSHSEADLALVNILAFYSNAPAQVARMFSMSGLYNSATDDKYRKRPNLLNDMIGKSFDRKPPLVSIPQLIVPQVAPQTPAPAPQQPVGPDPDSEEARVQADDPFTMPPGLTGAIASFVYQQAPYPMKEAAIMAALALMAGITGRQYQVEAKGLNLYLMLLANTGSGKEAMSTGIGRIMDAVCDPPVDINAPPPTNIEDAGLPSARCFRGPAKVTGKGLMTVLAKCDSLSMFSIFNEFADTMRQMADPRSGNQGIADLKQILLDLYMKSSQGNAYAGHVTADKDTSIKTLSSPAYTFLSECTPNKLYSYLNEDLINDGMLPRMIIFESHGFGTYNKFHASVKPDVGLIKGVRALCKSVFDMKVTGDSRVEVQFTPDALECSEAYRVYAREQLTGKNADETTRQLWNRAHLNAERIAALLAIGCDRFQPTITTDMMNWATRIITRQIVLLVGKFKRGETGTPIQDDRSIIVAMRDVVAKYMAMDPENMPKSWFKEADNRRAGVVSHRYLSNRCEGLSDFRKHPRGHVVAFKMCVDMLTAEGVLTPANGPRGGRHYMVSL